MNDTEKAGINAVIMNLIVQQSSMKSTLTTGKVKQGALQCEASPRQNELANPKPQRDADTEPLPWQISQKYTGPQVRDRSPQVNTDAGD